MIPTIIFVGVILLIVNYYKDHPEDKEATLKIIFSTNGIGTTLVVVGLALCVGNILYSTDKESKTQIVIALIGLGLGLIITGSIFFIA